MSIDLGPTPTPEEERILSAFRDQTPIELNGRRVLIVEASYERDGLLCRFRYSTRWLDT